MDSELQKSISAPAYRYIDDYEFCCSDVGEAERVLAQVEANMAGYELRLNPRKTFIRSLPQPFEFRWVIQLRDFKFKDPARKHEIAAYFDLAFELSDAHKDSHVLKYAVARLRAVGFDPAAWELVQFCLCQMLTVDSSSIREVMYEYSRAADAGASMKKDVLTDTLTKLILKHAPLQHGSEVAWALWAGIEFGLKFDSSVGSVVENVSDSIVAIVALDAERRGVLPGLSHSAWLPLMSLQELYDEHWLLAYEASVQGWLPTADSADHVNADANFKYLKDCGVIFYNHAKFVSAPGGKTSPPSSSASLSASAAPAVPVPSTSSSGDLPRFSLPNVTETLRLL